MEEAEKAKEQAEQDGFDMGVVETEEAFRVEVSEVCRFYCLQVWNEALDQAGVEASFALRWAESAYYPPAIGAPGSSGSKVDTAFLARKVQQKLFLQLTSPPPKEAKQYEVVEKAADIAKEVAHDTTLPPTAPKDPSKEKEASYNMEIVLATLPIPTKEDLKGKGPTSFMVASTQLVKTSKDKLVLKMKP